MRPPQELTEWLGLIIAVVAAIEALRRFALLGVRLYRWAKRMERMIEYVDTELRHNGGNSLRDHVVNIVRRLEAGDARFATIDDHLTDLDGRLGALDAGVGELRAGHAARLDALEREVTAITTGGTPA